MRFAYADPPYLGCCARYGHYHEKPYGCWDRPQAHFELLARLSREYDGWALSASAASLQQILPGCPTWPSTPRVAAWVKPFASFKPNVNPGYCWEPVIFQSARGRSREEPTVRDFLSEPITLERGLVGAKSEVFCRWILDLIGYQRGDQMDDLFPGTGVMGRVLAQGVLL